MRSTQWNGTEGPSRRVQCRRRKLVISQLLNALSIFLLLGEDLEVCSMLTARSRGRKFPCEGSQQSGSEHSGKRGRHSYHVLICSLGTTATLGVFSFGFLQSGSELHVCVVCPRNPENMARTLQETDRHGRCSSGLAMERGARGHQHLTLGQQNKIKQGSGQRRISGVQLCRRRYRRRRCKHRPQQTPLSPQKQRLAEPIRRVVNALEITP